MDDFDERVRQRAYRLWVEEGCPEGRSEVHWEKARDLVAHEDNQKTAKRAETAPISARPTAASATRTQGEASPPRRAAAAQAPSKRKTSEPKPPKDTGAKRR
jgi:hypothetical protein